VGESPTQRTKIQERNKAPSWNEEFLLYVWPQSIRDNSGTDMQISIGSARLYRLSLYPSSTVFGFSAETPV
jgi:hypothetical protein